MRTLVLDCGYRPINAVSFAKAMVYVAKGKADVLESYGRWVHPKWRMPAVVRLTGWLCTFQQRVKFSRQNVLLRDRWCCQYCGERKETSQLTFDHVQPKCRGGRTSWDNIVIACRSCNSRKGGRTPKEARMPLRKQPREPAWLPIFNAALRQRDVPAEWRDYWTVELIP